MIGGTRASHVAGSKAEGPATINGPSKSRRAVVLLLASDELSFALER
jgi:hypothetical protein